MGHGIPPGWVSVAGKLEPGNAVSDYAARGQVIKARCASGTCNRRATLDPEKLCRQGQGGLSRSQAERLWKCQRLDGCDAEFHTEPSRPHLTLGALAGLSHVRLRVRCSAKPCTYTRLYVVEAVIAGLRKREQGGSETNVLDFTAKLTSPCPACRKARWDMDVLWAETDSYAWKAGADAYFRGK